MKKTRIAYVIGSMGNARAGTEKNLVTLIQNLDRESFEPILFTLQDCEFIQAKKFECETHCLHVYRMFMPKMFDARKRLADHFRELKVDVVQTFFTEAHLIGGWAAQEAKVRAIISSRRNLGYSYGLKEKFYLRIANRYPHRILANSKAVADAISAAEGLARGRIDVIYNGINPGARHEGSTITDDGPRRVMLVANLRAVKSIETLLKAAPAVIEQVPEVRFEIVGDGNERRHLEQMSHDLNLQQHLIFHGSRPDVDRLLEGAAVGVLTSTSEGLSNSILEYMRASMPVVATNVGGNKEVVRNGQTGFLIPIREPEILSQKLVQLLQDDEMRREMGNAGRELLEEKFSLSRMVEAHQEYYLNLLKDQQPR